MKNNTNILPKNIKRIRPKKYTKRTPYKSYLSATWKWTDIFNEIDKIKNTNKSYLKATSLKYGIKYSTLAKKYRNYCNNKKKNNNILVDNENRGGSNKIFTIDEEREIYTYVRTNFIDNNKPLNNNIIKEIALNKFKNTN